MVCSYLNEKIRIQEASILPLILSKFEFQFKSIWNQEEKMINHYLHNSNSNSKLEDIFLEDGWGKANPNRDNEDNSN